MSRIQNLLRFGLSANFVFFSVACSTPPESIHSVLQDIASSGASEELLQSLKKHDGPVLLTELVKDPTSYGLSEAQKDRLTSIEAWQSLQVEIPVDEHKSLASDKVMLLFAPDVPEANIRSLEAYDAQGHRHVLSVDEIPNHPVITLSRIEKLDPTLLTPLPSEQLLEHFDALAESKTAASLKLDSIRFEDVSEPWFKGRSEMYMVVAYVTPVGTGGTSIVDLRGVDRARVTYNVNKVFHFWESSKYQIVDVAFFEHDSNYNYAQLASILANVAAKIGTANGIPAIDMVSNILDAAIGALSSDVLTDTDDFLDAINTLEPGQSGSRDGIRRNVKASFSNYTVGVNP